MQSEKTQSKKVSGALYRAIPVPPPIQAGEIGQAAVTDAANHQLDRYAQDIEQYLQTSQMRDLLDKLQAEVNPAAHESRPPMRLHRE